jgi:two-component system NtrC family sensor kinase
LSPRDSTPAPDLTTLVHDERGSAAALALLAALLDELPCGVLVLDAEGRVLRSNRGERERAGRTADELAGRDFFRELAPHLEVEGLGPEYRADAAAGRGAALEAETLLSSPAGKRIVRLVLRSLVWRGAPYGILLLDDRTELAAEADRRKRAERLAAVGELAAGVAHEVNTPLASIKSFAQLLSRDATGAAQREALEIIIQESTRAAGVVGNLLSFARRQGAGGREPVDLNAIAERSLTLQRYALETAGITVRRDYDATLSPVLGESGALLQVVLNLVVNAEQALASREVERLLIVRTRESSEGVILSVVDNGPGIAKELLPSIFDSFRTTKAEGTGLGLGISATIIRDHAGQIWAESEEGRGAAFFIRLPRAAEVEPTAVAPPGPAVPARGTVSPRELRILVADDEPALRMAVTLFLERRGHTVVEAADAHEALRLAESQPFDVALVDARMPGDGLVLLEKLEAMPALRDRTALMTGDLGRARTQHGIATGRPCLTKPFDMDEMVRLIERLGR